MTTKIGFILPSPAANPVPSTRVAALNMFPLLEALGWAPEVVFEPASATEQPDLGRIDPDALARAGFRAVFFQKIGHGQAQELAKALSTRGIRTVFMVCDVINPPMAEATDATVVVTDFLKQLYPASLQSRITVIHDGIERPELWRKRPSEHHATPENPLHAVLVTSARLDSLPVIGAPPPWLRVTVVGRYKAHASRISQLRDWQWNLRQLPGWRAKWQSVGFWLHPRIRCVPWHPDGVYDWLLGADAGIIPIETPRGDTSADTPPSWMVKSENRLTLKMSAGLPVIATPIPSYEPVVTQGVDSFLARTPGEWLEYLGMLRDPATRFAVGTAARNAVAERFSMRRQAEKLDAVLSGLLA